MAEEGISTVNKEEIVIFSIKEDTPKEKIGEFFTKVTPQLFSLQDIKGSLLAIYWIEDPAAPLWSIEAGVPVDSSREVTPPFNRTAIPAGKYLLSDHFGDYATLPDAWKKTFEYIGKNNIKNVQGGYTYENYLVGPGQEADTSKWHTQIFIQLHDE